MQVMQDENYARIIVFSCDVTLRIIWPNFMRAIWHIAAQFISDRSRGIKPPFRHSPQPVISIIYRILDQWIQCILQEIKVSAGHSAERLRQISSKLLCQIIRKVTQENCGWA